MKREAARVSIGLVVGIRIDNKGQVKYLVDLAKPPNVNHCELAEDSIMEIAAPRADSSRVDAPHSPVWYCA